MLKSWSFTEERCAMVNRSIATVFRLCAAASLVVLGTTALLQVAGAAQAAAAGSFDGIFGWGTTPALESLPAGVTPLAVAAGETNGYAIGSDGNLYAWGPNISGSLPIGEVPVDATTPVVISLPAGVTPTAIAASFEDGYAIGSDGNLYAWGRNGDGELGIGNNTGPDACPVNGFGQPGPTEPCAATPVKVDLPPGVTPTAITTAGPGQSPPSSAYAIGSNGKLYAWGDNGSGALGDGNTSESDTPVVVSLPSGVTPTAIAGGTSAAYAMGSDGNLYAWGDNAWGALGNGTTTSSNTPVEVSLPPGVTPKAISGGGGGVTSGFGYMIGSDGNLYAWGYNHDGELGDGTTTGPDVCSVTLPPPFSGTLQNPCSTTPVRVSLPSGVTATAMTGNGSGGTAIGSDGNLYAWGNGQLGNGSSGGSDTPVVVSVPSGSVGVSLGQGYNAIVSYAIVNEPDVAPSITTQPTGQSVFAGQDATFTAAASGYPATTVQWQVSTDGGVTFSPVSGATSDTLNIADTTVAENGNEYEAVFTNGTSPNATTDPATLSVSPDVIPGIITNPLNQSVYEGQTASFSAAASGTPTPSVRWQVSVNGGSTWIDSAVTSTTISGMPPAYLDYMDGWEFRAVFTNLAGSATTNAATLTVLPAIAPVVTTDPINQSVAPGGTASFSAAASGTPTPTVQWQVSVNGGSTWIDTAVTSTTITGMPPAYLGYMNGWEFRAVFTNGGGSATTTAATLTVT
jgi:alpha-tubulin suppressor-like RCC1 family protein